MTDDGDPSEPSVPLGRQSAADKRAAETVALNRDQVQEMMAQASSPQSTSSAPGDVPPVDSEPFSLDRNLLLAGVAGIVVILLVLFVVLG